MAMRTGAPQRWISVGAVVAVLIALPLVIAAWPVTDQERSVAELRTAALASAELAFSGDAQSAGGLALPAAEQLGSLTDLFSTRTTMRVWWRSSTDHRVDVVTSAGETDMHTDASGAWTWNYEANEVTRVPARTALQLPAPADLLPPPLARRLLSEAEPGELTRIGAERVAGRDVLGLRLTPAAPGSSVGRVDIWIDAGTGLPLQVQLFGAGAANPGLDSRFLDIDLGTPAASITAFAPPAGADRREAPDSGLLDAADRTLDTLPFPDALAGLPRRSVAGAPAAIGLYGRGITLLAVVPLPYGVAADLRSAAAQDPGAVTDETGTRLAAGPLGLLLTATVAGDSYLLTGTVTPAALRQAALQLPDLRARS
jgi:outer membrane lipoprotein-sorting protein